MLIGPDTSLADIDADIDAEIARCNREAKRLPPASDEYVRKHAELNRLCRVRDSYALRDKPAEASDG